MGEVYYSANGFSLYHADCRNVMKDFRDIDMIFADPPFFLSNDGLTIQSGKVVSVNKGDWDKCDDVDAFNYDWIKQARECLSPKGTIWTCGTMHNIFSVYRTLNELDFKVLNTITWQKQNPPPNFSCRYFTHSTEFIVWARKEKKVAHYYNYDLMKALNDGSPMKDVWTFPSISKWEKAQGKHPTQKPLSVVTRAVLASTKKGETILDPFCGSATTGIAAFLFGRNFLGVDVVSEYLKIGQDRYIEASKAPLSYINKIRGIDYEIVVSKDGQ